MSGHFGYCIVPTAQKNKWSDLWWQPLQGLDRQVIVGELRVYALWGVFWNGNLAKTNDWEHQCSDLSRNSTAGFLQKLVKHNSQPDWNPGRVVNHTRYRLCSTCEHIGRYLLCSVCHGLPPHVSPNQPWVSPRQNGWNCGGWVAANRQVFAPNSKKFLTMHSWLTLASFFSKLKVLETKASASASVASNSFTIVLMYFLYACTMGSDGSRK